MLRNLLGRFTPRSSAVNRNKRGRYLSKKHPRNVKGKYVKKTRKNKKYNRN